MEKWYERWAEHVEQFHPPLKESGFQYLQRGEKTYKDLCECKNGHCISCTYWWAVQEIYTMLGTHNRYNPYTDISLRAVLKHFKMMFASHIPEYSLQFHSPETEEKQQAAYQDILHILENAIEAKQVRE